MFDRQGAICYPISVSRLGRLAYPIRRAWRGTTATEVNDLKFNELSINEKIIRAVTEIGFEEATPIQARAIPVVLEGKDIIGQAQTGTGKTAAFGIPILEKTDPKNKNIQALVLCPTRELAIQVADEIRRLAKFMHGIKVIPIYGGQDIVKQIRSLKSGVQIVIGTPGRVMDHMRRRTARFDHVSMVVLDEADEMLNMGFRDDIETILEAVPRSARRCCFPRLCLSRSWILQPGIRRTPSSSVSCARSLR